jgi:hypothetical protein
MYVGVIGVMIAGVQPLLLGALQQEGRLSAAQLGQAATAELLTMGLTAGLAGALLKPRHLRWLGLVAGLLLAGLDMATTKLGGDALTALRAVAGVPSGLLMWITIGMVTRAPRPERWSGVYLTVQTLAQFLLSLVLTSFVVARYGANGGFLALAAISALAGLSALLAPSHYAPLAHQAEGSGGGLPNIRGWVALAACFLFLASIVAVWVYAEPLSHQAGHGPQIFGYAVSISLISQVAGGAAATVLASRLPWFWTLLGCTLANLLILLLFFSLPGPVMFLIASGAFGFIWLFVLPFLVPMVITADPTRRAGMLLAGAQLLGGSLGPFMASMIVSDADARGAILFGAACLVAAMVIVTGLHLRPARGLAS